MVSSGTAFAIGILNLQAVKAFGVKFREGERFADDELLDARSSV
jgi:hypothetical protein